MTTITSISNIGHGVSDSDTNAAEKSLRRWNAGLFASAVLGAVSGLVGLTIGFLTLIELLVPTHNLYAIGTILIGASFVLFGLAAHCLDRAGAVDKAIRLEYCRQHGLRDRKAG